MSQPPPPPPPAAHPPAAPPALPPLVIAPATGDATLPSHSDESHEQAIAPSPAPEPLPAALPQLPSVAPAPSAAPHAAAADANSPVSALPGTEGLTAQQIAAIHAGTAASSRASSAGRSPSPRSVGRSVVRTGFAVVLAAGLGLGAHAGFDEYQSRQSAGGDVPADPEAVDAGADRFPQLGDVVQLPDVRFADITLQTPAGEHQHTTDIRTDLASTDRAVSFRSTDPEFGPYLAEIVGDKVFSTLPGDPVWRDAGGHSGIDELVAGTGDVADLLLTMSDLITPEMSPHITVIEQVDTTMQLVPQPTPAVTEVEAVDDVATGLDELDPARVDQDPGAIVVAPVEAVLSNTTPAPTTRSAVPVRQYRVVLDRDAFAADNPLGFFALVDDDDFEDGMSFSIDEAGLVRRLDLGDVGIVTINEASESVPAFLTPGRRMQPLLVGN